MSSAVVSVLGSLFCFFFPRLPRAFWTPALNFLSEELNCLPPFVSDPLSGRRQTRWNSRRRDVVVFECRGRSHDHDIGSMNRWVVDRAPGAGVSGASGRTEECLGHLPFQPTAGLEVQGLVDRFVAHPHALVVREISDQSVGDLLGEYRRDRPCCTASRNPGCSPVATPGRRGPAERPTSARYGRYSPSILGLSDLP